MNAVEQAQQTDWSAIAATLSAATALVSVVLSLRAQRNERVASESRSQRGALYERILTAVREQRLEFNTAEFTPQMLLFGSDEVVRSWNKLLKKMMGRAPKSLTPDEFLPLFVDVLLAMRRDIGHASTDLNEYDARAAFGLPAGTTYEQARSKFPAKESAE